MATMMTMMMIMCMLMMMSVIHDLSTLQVSVLPPALRHLWLADVTTPGLTPGDAQNPASVQNPMLGQTLAGRLPQLLTLVLRSAAPGGPPVVSAADLAAIATGARKCTRVLVSAYVHWSPAVLWTMALFWRWQCYLQECCVCLHAVGIELVWPAYVGGCGMRVLTVRYPCTTAILPALCTAALRAVTKWHICVPDSAWFEWIGRGPLNLPGAALRMLHALNVVARNFELYCKR
jgi:hypothetical protein